jgi:hypothetical protein
MNRLNQILVVVLVLQMVVAAIILLPRPTASGEGESLFPGVEAERIVGLTITSADGKSIRLAKVDGGWALPEADDYPVEEDKVPPLLDKLVGLTSTRLVTQTSGSHKRLGVAEDSYERLVEFEMDDGTRHRLYVGTSPSFSVVHVRADGQDEVYLASDLSTSDVGVQATDWTGRNYFSVPRDQVVAVTLENENGRFEFTRDGDAWAMQGLATDETLDETTVETVLSRATSVAMLRPLGREEKAEYGLGKPSAVVILQTRSAEGGDKMYTLRVGAKDPEDNSYTLISSESPYYVQVSEFTVKDWIEKVRDDFLELPPTPTPEAAPEAAPETAPGATPASP